MPEWAAGQWISNWWIYGLSVILLVGAIAAVILRLHYRRSQKDEPRWVNRLFDLLQIGLMFFVFLVFARFVTGFWH